MRRRLPRSTLFPYTTLFRPRGVRRELRRVPRRELRRALSRRRQPRHLLLRRDRKSTRLNSSHQIISYAVFCLKKKKQSQQSQSSSQDRSSLTHISDRSVAHV